MSIRAASTRAAHTPPLRLVGPTALLILSVAIPGPSAAERLFAVPRFMALDTYPYGVNRVGIVDITGDRVPDLVWVGKYSGTYGDFWSRVGCFVGPQRDFELSPGTPGGGLNREDFFSDVGMAMGDVNGDGRSDVLTIADLDSRAELWVSLGSATGLQVGSAIKISGTPSALGVGDFDGDGRSDVAVARMMADSVSIFRGLADGSLAQASGFAVGSPYAQTVGDLNNDGRLDIVVGDWAGRLHAFLGDGGGDFALQWGNVSVGRQVKLGLADFNRDTRLDLIVEGGVLLGDGAGGFGPMLSHGVDGAFAAGDLNSDGRLDLAVASNAGLLALLGRGDGTFAQMIVKNRDFPWADPAEVAVGDLDQDGKLDITVAAGGIANFYGNGDGTFGRDIPSYPLDDGARALVAGDVNGDGRADLAVINRGSTTLSLLLSTPGGALLPRRNLETGAVPEDLVLKDFDRDGILDLAVAQPEARRVSVLGGHGDGTFGLPTVIPVTTGKPSALATGDLDEDGFLDLVVSSDTGVWVIFGGPSGIGASGRFVNAIPSPGRGQQIVVDFTGDGLLDIARQGDDIDFVAGRGDGTFGSPVHDEFGHDNDAGFAGPLLAIGNDACSYGVFSTWYCCGCTNCGDDLSLRQVLGTRGRAASLDGFGAASDQVGDFNGDGTDDLLTFGGFVLLGPGFESRQRITPYQSADIAFGDVNGDAKLDLFLLRGSDSAPRRSVEVFLNQSARPAVPQTPGNLKAVSGGASIALSWGPVLHPGLAGYRVRYGAGLGEALAGTEASEGPSPIEVPVGQTSLTLHCLPDSTFWVKVTSVDDLGRESKCPRPVTAHPGPAGGDFSFMGGSLNAASQGRWIMGRVQLDAGLSAARIVPGTVMVNGVGPADQLGVTDRDHDGRSELMIRFPRSAVQGGGPRVRVEGRVAGCRDTLRFAVDDSNRVRKPGAQPQAGAEDGHEGDPSVIAFALHPVAPSPASAGCAITFDLPEPAVVRLSVFDLRGRLMSTVLDRDMPAGSHRVWWDRQSLPDGVYFAKIEAGTHRAVRTVVLIR